MRCFLLADGRHAWWHDCEHSIPGLGFNFEEWFVALCWDIRKRNERKRVRDEGQWR